MTRINIIPVQELCNQHLFAEYREMPRLVGNLQKSLTRSTPFSKSEIPNEYVLGKGHVKFFYDKFKFLDQRHAEITAELLRRGYKIELQSSIFNTVPSEFYGDYIPTKEAIELNKERIKIRMPKNPKWRVK